ncbi:threonine/serine dehydratase [Amycolatopsis suaedae]|uniref:Threonine/serine dehydratase n=1 Tax=Amycolatopsis suaedae TaxID=2510978 RepID=A0A4V2ELW4_9PSEU|nr:threonine/serine dehydratase [Amycolatopsis suaedae]RZQ62975.1 threonine/serine dehydratase [Amycolatopsis suaedae]
MRLLDLDDIRKAAARLDGLVLRTPLLDNERLSAEVGGRVLLKPENLQHTASFKVRGALNTLLTWRERGTLPEGVVGFSAGNHAAALSYAGKRLGVRVLMAMPPDAPASKVDNVRRYGGEITRTEDLLGTCAELAERHGFPVVHPFDLPEVMAGQGTVGLELAEDGPAPGLVLVPVGGGGLLSGVAAAVRELAPSARIVGVEPARSNAVALALRAGEPVPLRRVPTLADGLTAPITSALPLAHVQRLVDDVVEVAEEDIESAWRHLSDATKLVVEPSAAVGLAALRAGVVGPPESGPTVLVLSGGNAP